jgi:hypothetical protein
MFASLAPPHLFPPQFFALYLSGKCLRVTKSCWGYSLKVLGKPLTHPYSVTLNSS